MNVFDPMIHISTITLVGCGGTGGQLARTIARIVYDMKQRRMHAPKIRLIDPDIVPPDGFTRGNAYVMDAQLMVMESYPVQVSVQVEGELPTQ